MAQITSTFSKIDEYGFERSSNFDYTVYGEFMSNYLSILAKRERRWKSLKEVDKQKKNRTLKRFMRKGVPLSERTNMWMSVSSASLIKEQSKFTYFFMKGNIENNSITDIIEVDLPRTFPDNIYFSKESNIPQQLFNVLATFASQNEDVGYCQGLNYIAGLLLLVTKSEETTFWLLKALVEVILPQYYIKSMSGLITDLAVLDELVKTKEPALHRHIQNVGMPWAVASTKWFICLYSEVLPIETVFRIWDCLFFEGSKIIFRVALTLIRLHKNELLECTDLSDMVTCFRNMSDHPKVIDCHTFMLNVFKLPGSLTNSYLEKLRKKHSIADVK